MYLALLLHFGFDLGQVLDGIGLKRRGRLGGPCFGLCALPDFGSESLLGFESRLGFGDEPFFGLRNRCGVSFDSCFRSSPADSFVPGLLFSGAPCLDMGRPDHPLLHQRNDGCVPERSGIAE